MPTTGLKPFISCENQGFPRSGEGTASAETDSDHAVSVDEEIALCPGNAPSEALPPILDSVLTPASSLYQFDL